MANNALKTHLIKRFSEKYGTMRDYYDRFSDLYGVFFLLAIICQLWAGWAEAHFFGAEMDGVISFPSPGWALGTGLLAAAIFELTKTRIGHKVLQEFYGAQNKLHAPLLAVWLAMMVLSAWIGYIGIGAYTAGHRAAAAPTDSQTEQVDALYLPQIESVQAQVDGLTRKYTWRSKYNGIPAVSWPGGPPQQQLDQDRALMQSLEKRLAMLQEQHLRERQQAQGLHASALSAYQQQTEKKVFNGRFFTIITELIYALCLWYNAYFAAEAARTATSPPPPTPPAPRAYQVPTYNQGEAKQNTYPINGRSFTPPRLNAIDSDAEAKKQPQGIMPESQSESHAEIIETVIETRTCAHCESEFKVDTRRDSTSRPKKYCSPGCLNEGRLENNRKRREQKKERKNQWKINTPTGSQVWRVAKDSKYENRASI